MYNLVERSSKYAKMVMRVKYSEDFEMISQHKEEVVKYSNNFLIATNPTKNHYLKD